MSRIVVITGASDGIGAAAAKQLAAQGDTVVLVGRSPDKTRAVAQDLGCDFFVCDFTHLQQVRELAAQLTQKYPRIDVLANNAGGIMAARELTQDGFEKTFQVNHLAPFLLTNLLLDTLAASHATVVNTSSAANFLMAKFDIQDLNGARKYTSSAAYGNAKLANILFTKELQRRYGARGIATAAFHPGIVGTNFSAEASGIVRFGYNAIAKRFMLTAEQGADTLVWLAATLPGEVWTPGQYYIKRKVATPNKLATDPALAESLWEQSAEMVGLVEAPRRF